MQCSQRIVHKRCIFMYICTCLQNFTVLKSFLCKQMSAGEIHGKTCGGEVKKVQQDTGYYVLRRQAVPEVLLKVVEAKKLLESGKVKTINEAAASLGISRSSFYKYKDDIYEFHDSMQGTTLTLSFQMNDEVGLLSYVLGLIADFAANILTIHQSIPLNGVASISITIQVLPTTRDIMEMISIMEKTEGVHKVHITGRSATLE